MSVSLKLGFTVLAEGFDCAAGINDAIARVGASITVKERRTSNPGGSPVEGDAYLIGPTSTWTGGHLGEIAVWTGGAYAYITPFEGLRTYVQGSGASMIYTGSAWEWTPKSVTSVTSISTGNTTLSFAEGSSVSYQMSTSGGTYTILPPTNNMIQGQNYTALLYNSSAGSVTVSLTPSLWDGFTNWTVTTGKRLMLVMAHPNYSALPIILADFNGLTAI